MSLDSDLRVKCGRRTTKSVSLYPIAARRVSMSRVRRCLPAEKAAALNRLTHSAHSMLQAYVAYTFLPSIGSMKNTVWAEVNLSAIRDNLAAIRHLCPRSRIMAVIKADGYGHGLLAVAAAMRDADGFAVARLQEAIKLRTAGIKQRVLLLGTLLDLQDLALCGALEIDIVVHDESSLAAILAQARRTPLRVWLKLDTGMHRIGFDCDAFKAADRVLSVHPGILELIHMTHLSSADNPESGVTDDQLSKFWKCRSGCSQTATSVANSAALLTSSRTHTEWVRPGLLLYGERPLAGGHLLSLRLAMRVRAAIIAVRRLETGESVGYNGRWTAGRSSRIGTIGMGYADGYPRHAKDGTPVWVNGVLVPLVGQVSMDSLTVDLTECPGAEVGDNAILWGPELAPRIVARSADSIAYQLFTTLGERVGREYVDMPQ